MDIEQNKIDWKELDISHEDVNKHSILGPILIMKAKLSAVGPSWKLKARDLNETTKEFESESKEMNMSDLPITIIAQRWQRLALELEQFRLEEVKLYSEAINTMLSIYMNKFKEESVNDVHKDMMPEEKEFKPSQSDYYRLSEDIDPKLKKIFDEKVKEGKLLGKAKTKT